MTTPEELARAKHAVVEAPAGCGKTHLIAEAVGLCDDDLPQLVLTHTHAGVDALRKHLATLGVARRRFVVETIAGWALRWAASFPETSGVQTDKPTGPEWDTVYGATVRLLQMEPYKHILRCSYAGVYVDEYQDCTVEQHGLVLALAEVLPCRILGDPLQGIFGFGRNHLIDWAADVLGTFTPLPPLAKPWRWKGKNEVMGQWLHDIRQLLLDGKDIPMTGLPQGVRHETLEERKGMTPDERREVTPDAQKQSKCCFDLLKREDAGHTSVAIQQPFQYHTAASLLGGKFSCIEPIDTKELLDRARRIGETSGRERAVEVIDFAAKCMTHVSTIAKTVRNALARGKDPRPKKDDVNVIWQGIRPVVLDDRPDVIVGALRILVRLPKVNVYRWELLLEMVKALKEYASEEFETLHDAAWHVRSRTRHIGRPVFRRCVGSTLLVKGLEFDHAVVLDADGYNARDLYVALTRGSRSLTILSRDTVLHPSQ
ncbi:MAG: AAA family ATPase [Deltaproteobacteria bacterium]|nr:AAA family ATPase [Deltaproteobacteria bacterium]